ncbi:MAG: aromatic ring-hydroxylating dioxygenase subunit alpha [Xanthobacteraceae bacterium]
MFLRNGWYPALWSHELDDKPVAKTFLDEKVVLFRNAGGAVGALEDCCCHRAAPLSLGEVSADHLVCGYHGLKFDVDGQCVAVPGQTLVPAGAKVRSYPVAQKWNVVWIWMGDRAKADPAKIPDMPWLSEPKWTATPGRLHVKSNYQFIVDNLLDFTHVAHVHKRTIAGDPREATEPLKTERLNDGIGVSRWLLDVQPPPLFAKAGNFSGKVDRWQLGRWHPPSVVYIDVGCAKAATGASQGDRSAGISIWSTHLVTPETELSSHYMFCFSRDFDLEDEGVSKLLYEGSRATFLEDVDFLEAVQSNRTDGSLDGLIHIAADAAQLQARRMIGSMIAAEQAP